MTGAVTSRDLLPGVAAMRSKRKKSKKRPLDSVRRLAHRYAASPLAMI
jgi:hypothetical protein